MPARTPAPLLVVAAAFSVQLGAALATTLFDRAGPLGTVLVRLGWGALLLLALNPGFLRRARRLPLRPVLLLGLVLAALNSAFYASLERIPLGVAVTVEFLGPLAVAVAGSRRARDFAWVVLAGGGVALLGSPTVDVDGAGLLLALAAGGAWAVFILLSKRVADTWPLRDALTVSMAAAALATAPAGILAGGSGLADPAVLATGIAVAVLASVVPFGLELAALRRLSPAAFGILLSLEPAVAALVGALALGQVPGALQGLAIGLVVAASAGASVGAREPAPPEA